MIFLCSLFVLAGYRDSSAAAKSLPFRQGERMVYRAMWGIIPAGEAVIEVLPIRRHRWGQGPSLRHDDHHEFPRSTYSTKSARRQDSFTDIPMTRTLQYRKNNTGDHPRDVIVTFDWDSRTATYASFGNAEKPVEILPGSFDPLALFFVIRTYRLKLGDVIEIPITDGKKCITVRASVAGRETLTIDGKVYDTYLVIPDMERLQGVVPQKGDPSLKIWFSADQRQVPVKIQSKVAVGSFVFELVSVTF